MKWLKKEATINNLNEMIDFILDNLKVDTNISYHMEMQIRLLCEEAFVNIINHAYPSKNGIIIAGYEFDKKNNYITVKMCDYGIEFNPINEKNPDITCDIMQRDVGGLGIFLLKEISDSIGYERKKDMNILTIRKYCMV
ncbi:ATP-binding protein [Clostridium sp. BJN0001]|uniref:ATP-binding protein n=1 Tax=Clostridium sp. BJN0001 TaxID=2930219 RepID=UPI001FD3271A|nr:ATP-binding protein [Clostridium sp. BJN0001]